MATRISNTRDHLRAAPVAVPTAPYAGRGAGLYSEVGLSPVSSPLAPRLMSPVEPSRGSQDNA